MSSVKCSLPYTISGTAPLILAALILAGCAGGDAPITPSMQNGLFPAAGSSASSGAGKIISTDGPRLLWGLYDIIVTPDWEVQVGPMRDAAAHFNLTQFLQPPKCKYCITLQKTGLDTSESWISFNVGLANPTKLAGYDVRGIIISGDDYYLMNADALTPYAGPVIYAAPNGFKAYATDQPDNTFPAGGDPGNPLYFTQEFKIHIPPPYAPSKLLKIKYAVDVSWPQNCQDPWYIGDFVLPGKVFESTPSMDFTIDIEDHQDNIQAVTIDAPAGWLGPAPELSEVDEDTWSGTIDNCANNPAGEYAFYVTATSLDSSTPPKTLYLYKNVILTIDQFTCLSDVKNDPSGAIKLPLQAEVRDSVCENNPRDYFLIDFSDPSMQQPGGLSGSVTLYSCTPGMRLDLVYYDQTGGVYYDGNYVTGSSDGTAVLRVHIPNSEIAGAIVEKCYVRVRLPSATIADVPYHMVSDLVYKTDDCGDAVSISTVGAPDIPFAGGMVQGVLCEPTQMDWYRIDTTGPDATPGNVTGNLTVDIEYPDPLPPAEVTAVSLHDEDGTLLANFYVSLPPTPAVIDLGSLDLPSKYTYYLCVSSPTQSIVDRSYRITWQAQINSDCGPDLINLTNPSAPEINPVKTEWNSMLSPGSCARMWLCNPDDLVDGYPFAIPSGWASAGKTLGGTVHIQSDPTSYQDVRVVLGLQQTIGGTFSWFAPMTLSSADETFNIGDYSQAPLDIGGFPLKYWFKIESTGDDWASAQVELNLKPATGCPDDADSADDPSGSLVAGGTITSYISPSYDIADYWDLDWTGLGRIKGDIGLVAPEDVRLRLYQRGKLLAGSEGMTPSINVDQFDLGSDCAGPTIRIEPLGGSPGQCIQYFLSGAGLSEVTTCDSNPDDDDTLEKIQGKPWLWLSPMDTVDESCGVVCREGSAVDTDTLGISGQPFTTQGILYGFVNLDSDSPDAHEVRVVSMDGAMVLRSSNIIPPFYHATVELSTYNLPTIPLDGCTYSIEVNPDPLGGDSISPYVCSATLGINTEIVDDGHDLESEAWNIRIQDSRLGMLCGFGELPDIDMGLKDLADWYKLEYIQVPGEFLEGTISFRCDLEGAVVRLLPEGQLAASGTALYEATIPPGGGTVTLVLPADTIPSVPAVGTDYFVVVHNNGQPGWTPYALSFDLASQ